MNDFGCFARPKFEKIPGDPIPLFKTYFTNGDVRFLDEHPHPNCVAGNKG